MNFLSISSPSVWQLGMRHIVKTVESFQNREEVIVQETVKKASCLPRELRHLIWSYVTSLEEMARSYLYTPWDSTECRVGKFFFNFIENHTSIISDHTMLRLDQIERMGFAYEGIFHWRNKEIPLNRKDRLSSSNPFNRFRVFSILHGFTRPTEVVQTYHRLQIPVYLSDQLADKIRIVVVGLFLLTVGAAVGSKIVWGNCSSNLERLISIIFFLVAILVPPRAKGERDFERYFEFIRSDDDFDSCCSRLGFVPFNGLRRGAVDSDGRPLTVLNLSQESVKGTIFGHEYLAKLRRIFNMTPLLHTLNMSYCNIGDTILETIVIQLPCLTSLDISGNSMITGQGFEFSLQFLTDFNQLGLRAMSQAASTLDTYLDILKIFPKLKYLDVSDNAFENDQYAYKALEIVTDRLQKLVIHKGTTANPITVEQVSGLRKKMKGRVVEIENDVG